MAEDMDGLCNEENVDCLHDSARVGLDLGELVCFHCVGGYAAFDVCGGFLD